MPDEIDWNANEWAGEKVFNFCKDSKVKIQLTFALLDVMNAKGWEVQGADLTDDDMKHDDEELGLVTYECPNCGAVEDYYEADDDAVWDEIICASCDEWFTVHLDRGHIRYIEPGQQGELPYEH